MDPRAFFLTLSAYTHPHGHEAELLPLLPELEQDDFGNYYLIIGESPRVMFTAHLDTADFFQSRVKHRIYIEDGDEYIATDGRSILGADDKAGITVLAYMIEHQVPGLYYFFIAEEVGRIGSRDLAGSMHYYDYMDSIEACVSFDRRKTQSVITHQGGWRCCSDEFAEALCAAFADTGLDFEPDDTGVSTDSLSFINKIPECTNISVGYRNEHTIQEQLNMSFLVRLCASVVTIDWAALPIRRQLT